ncbi:hypothetical protein M6G65_10140 [Methylobacterium tardum]|uniref:hypothetical protein n=1 Tax=Methylobacterium tardum TaxID=374432 RepID=UPI0020202A94|nr:hypothetical protein [Methylobacterium tardum]URD38736.1 hypothetical protein M6G65_10140 [Methylobacterium tardum]
MADIDPAKLVAALRKAMTMVEALSLKVEFLEEQNAKRARTEEELAQHLMRLRTEMRERKIHIGDVLIASVNALIDHQDAENERIRARLGEQEKDLRYLQSYVAGHEVALINLTGQAPELVLLEDLEAETCASPVVEVGAPVSYPEPEAGGCGSDVSPATTAGR